MAKVVLDYRGLLHYLRKDPGYEVVRDALDQGAAIDPVNLARVLKVAPDPTWLFQRLLALGLEVEPLLPEDALALAEEPDQPLERRAARALAERLKATVLDVAAE